MSLYVFAFQVSRRCVHWLFDLFLFFGYSSNGWAHNAQARGQTEGALVLILGPCVKKIHDCRGALQSLSPTSVPLEGSPASVLGVPCNSFFPCHTDEAH